MIKEQRPLSDSVGSGGFVFLSAIFFLSGAAGLMLQVVWMYRLGLVFGNAAYATAATLAAFFLGLALGGWFWGNEAARFRYPLTVYGLMEVGIALMALLWIQGLDIYETYYPSIVTLLGRDGGMLAIMKFVFSTVLLLLPTTLMGGTFPVLAEYVGRRHHQLASRGTMLYAVNTLGASLGAFLAGFFLLAEFGVTSTYTFAVCLAAGAGVMAVIMDKLSTSATTGTDSAILEKPNNKKKPTAAISTLQSLSYPQFIIIAFASGLLALSTETLWTRMFAQVLQNSVYSFSAILVVFLIALGIGGILAHILSRWSLPPVQVLFVLLCLGAIMIGLTPVIFSASTDGLGYLASGSSWMSYVWAVFKLSFLVVLLPTIVFGAVFPFLLKAAPLVHQTPGRLVGKLVLFNSFGSTVGPLIAGFILLNVVGLWMGIKIIAISYVGLALYISFHFHHKKTKKWIWLPLMSIIGLVAITNPPTVRLTKGENILNIWQSSDGVVSIVQSGENIQMKLDNFYVLGDSHSVLVEQMQAHIPLLIHPAPKNTLFLGMGTGITAGAALNHNVERIVVVELVTNVITAAQRYFSSLANGLFDDKRVEIVGDDARNFLLSTSEQFDVIVGDLFTPWHAGTGSLYTVEHFQQARDRLAPGGLFTQWLPLYQLTPESFKIITATFASVFPEVTLWRADFSGSRASIALIGQAEGSRLSQEVLQQNIVNVVGINDSVLTTSREHMAGLFYLGNIKALQKYLSESELNNDDRRVVEFEAPILSQQANAGLNTYMVGDEMERLFTTLATNLPVHLDPYLSDLPEKEKKYVEVGHLYFRYLQLLAAGKNTDATLIFEKIRTLSPTFLVEAPKNSN